MLQLVATECFRVLHIRVSVGFGVLQCLECSRVLWVSHWAQNLCVRVYIRVGNSPDFFVPRETGIPGESKNLSPGNPGNFSVHKRKKVLFFWLFGRFEVGFFSTFFLLTNYSLRVDWPKKANFCIQKSKK